MAIVTTLNTFLLVVLSMLVVGLLRSHALIVQKLEGLRASAQGGEADEPPGIGLAAAEDIDGQSLTGDPFRLALTPAPRDTLLAFLSTGCETCQLFWKDLGNGSVPLPDGVELVIVTRDRSEERLSVLKDAGPLRVPLIFSSAAWERYQVPVKPYFVLVEGGSDRIVGEGAARSWDQVLSLLRDALADRDLSRGARRAGAGVPSWRGDAVDAILHAAGIGPDHPSLYMAEFEDEQEIDLA